MSRLTPRDIVLLHAAQTHRGLCPEEAARLFFSTQKLARRRLLALGRARVFDRVQVPLLSGVGRAPYLYFPSAQGRAILAGSLGCATSQVRRVLPVLGVSHAGTVRSTLLVLHGAANAASIGFLGISEWKPYSTTPRLDLDVSPTERFRPDAVVCLSTHNAGSLLILEVDRETQTLRRRSCGPRDANAKIALYLRYFDTGAWETWRNVLGHQFCGFRVLYITESETRAQHLRTIAADLDDTGLIWVTTTGLLRDDPRGPIWISSHQEQGRHSLF